jgi:hypothetical protein
MYETKFPFEVAARAARSVFGVVSAIDAKAVNWMEGYLADNAETKLRLVISIHPTCRTSASDLQNLLRLVERHDDRAAFKVFPEASLADRSSNLLCLCGVDGDGAVTVGPTENMGFVPASPSQANLATVVTAATFEAYRKWFDYLWGVAGPLRPDVAASMPNLVLPEGDVEAARLWEDYRRRCLARESATEPPVRAVVDPESGKVVLVDQNNEVLPGSPPRKATSTSLPMRGKPSVPHCDWLPGPLPAQLEATRTQAESFSSSEAPVPKAC